jgi:hypothetical protein
VGAALQPQGNTPFDSIESAQEYLALLSEAVLESQQAAVGDLESDSNSQLARRVEALRLVVYNLDKLHQHLRISRRLLNDLRMLRRILLDEKADQDPSPPRRKAPNGEWNMVA